MTGAGVVMAITMGCAGNKPQTLSVENKDHFYAKEKITVSGESAKWWNDNPIADKEVWTLDVKTENGTMKTLHVTKEAFAKACLGCEIIVENGNITAIHQKSVDPMTK